MQVDTTDEANAPILERFRQIWTPDLRVLASDGYELDAFQGYWSPFELTARLLLGRARGLARQHDEPAAGAVYEEIMRRFPTSFVAAEAAYWRAVMRFKSSHEPDDLLGGWEPLRTRHPQSLWRMAQSFSEPPLNE